MTSNIEQLQNILRIQCKGDNEKYNEILIFLKNKGVLEETALLKPINQSDIVNISINNINKLSEPRYHIQYSDSRIIGRGGFGDVFISKYYLDRKIYAIKKIPIYEEDLSNIEDYLSEILILSHLDHRNIVRYYTSWIEIPNKDINELNKSETSVLPIKYSKFDEISLSATINSESEGEVIVDLYIQMELCKHFNLADIIPTLTSIDALNIIKEIIQGVKYLHSKNIVHRDIKPKNILFSLESNTVKLADFGLSCLENSDKRLITPNGTYLYIDPHGDLNSKSYDIYSLGVVITELVYKFKTRMERVEQLKKLKNGVIPIKLEKNIKNIITKCICANVNERYNIIELDEIINSITT